MKVMRTKTIKRCIGRLAILPFSLMVIISVSADATPVQLPFYDSFEGYNVCTVDPGPWQYLYSGVSAHVSDDWARSGNKSLRVEGRPYWARMEYVKLGTLPDLLSYEATVYIQSETERTDAWIGFMFKHPDTPYPGGADENAFRFYRNGEIWWYGKEGRYLCHYSVGDTFRLRAEIDGSTETADVYVYNLDDELLVYEADVPAWPHFIPKEAGLYSVDIILDQFGVSTGGYDSPGNTIVYVDDVKLEESAELPWEIASVWVTSMDSQFHPKRLYIDLKNRGTRIAKNVNAYLYPQLSTVIADDDYVEYGDIPPGIVASSNDDFEISVGTNGSPLRFELKLVCEENGQLQKTFFSFDLDNPGSDYNKVEWSELFYKVTLSEAASFLGEIVGIPTAPLLWLIEDISGGIYRDSVLLLVVDENGKPIDNVEVRNIVYEGWPWWLVPPEGIQWTKDGIVHWTDAESALPSVKVTKDSQSTYVGLTAYENLPVPEVPIITVIFYSDGTVEALYPKIRLEEKTLEFTVASPLNILIRDPLGFRLGYDSIRGEVFNEIPGATYSGPTTEPQVVRIATPLLGTFETIFWGTCNGTYTFTVALHELSGVTTQVYPGTIMLGGMLTSTTTLTATEFTFTEPSRMSPLALLNKISMARYIKTELQWLRMSIGNVEIETDVKEGLLDKVGAAIEKIDQAISLLEYGRGKQANNLLDATSNVLGAFNNQVKAQCDKGIRVDIANSLLLVGQGISQDIEATSNKAFY